MKNGILMVLSGPSGCGKGTLTKMLSGDDRVGVTISATTRCKRAGEEDGRDYYYMSKDEFTKRLEKGEFLEYNKYCGNLYGTLKEEVYRILNKGKDVVMEIDVCGAKQVSSKIECVKVFLLPPSLEELERRLRNRGTEPEQEIQKRLKQAKDELQDAKEYDYIVINDIPNDAADRLRAILNAQRFRSENMLNDLKGVIGNES